MKIVLHLFEFDLSKNVKIIVIGPQIDEPIKSLIKIYISQWSYPFMF